MLACIGFFVYFCNLDSVTKTQHYGKLNRKCESLWSEA